MVDLTYYRKPHQRGFFDFGERIEALVLYSAFTLSFGLALSLVGSGQVWSQLALPVSLGAAVLVALRLRLSGVLVTLGLQLLLLAVFVLKQWGCFQAARLADPVLFSLGVLGVFNAVAFVVAVVAGYSLQSMTYRHNVMQRIFGALPIGIQVRAQSGEVVYYNNRWAEFAPDPAEQETAAVVSALEQWAHMEAQIFKNQDGQLHSQAVQFVSQQGTTLTMTLLTLPIHIDHYGQEGTLVLLVDETILRTYEDRVRTTEQSLRLALDNAEMGFWDHDLASGKVAYNSNWLRTLDLDLGEQEAPFEAWKSRLHPEDKERVEAAYANYLETGLGTMQIDYRVRSGQDSYIWVQDYVGVAERNEGGSVRRIMGTMQNITGRKEIESDLKLQKERAESASEAKGQFLATMSHEIRTPLNAIIGLSSFLLESELTDDQEDLVDTIRSSGRSLMLLVDDILDYSKIEAKHVALEVQEYPLHLCFEDCVRLFKAPAQNKNVVLSLEMSPDMPEYALGDFVRLRQVIQNLLSNALKFTDTGRIDVKVSCVGIDDVPLDHRPEAWAKIGYLDEFKHEYLQVIIEDTGIGIPMDRQHVLFQAFSQVDASTTRKYGGTGLGLAICKRLVNAMGGEIWLESRSGEGARFGFVVRTQLVADSDAPEARDSNGGTALGVHANVALQYPCDILVVGPQEQVAGILNACRQLGYSPHHSQDYDLSGESFQRRRYNMILIGLGDEAPALELARELCHPSHLHSSSARFGCQPAGGDFSAEHAKLSGMRDLLDGAEQPEVIAAAVRQLTDALD